MDLSNSSYVKRGIGREDEIILLALSTIAYSEIVRWDLEVDSDNVQIATVNIYGHSQMVTFMNSVFRKLTRTLKEKVCENDDVLSDEQKASFMFGAADGILSQSLEVDQKRSYLNAFEQASERARQDPPELYLQDGIHMPVTPTQLSSVLDGAKRADPMGYKLGYKFAESLDIYQMFVDVAKMQKNQFKRLMSGAEEPNRLEPNGASAE